MFEPSLQNKQPRIAWSMLAAAAGLMILGAAFIYSATLSQEAGGLQAWYEQNYFKQVVWYGAGITLALALCFVDYKVLARWSFVFYWVSIGLLILVVIAGKTVYGAKRWIDLGLFTFQPSEFAKLAFIFAQAHFLSRPVDELRLPGVFWKSIGLIVLPFVLIMREPDLGSALIFLPVGLVMLYVAGTPVRYLGRLVGASAALLALLLANVLLAPPSWRLNVPEYQRDRLLVFFNMDFASSYDSPEEQQRARARQRDKNYNVEQALISVGTGGLTGKGWRQGTQNALGFLPRAVAHNDFIFSVIAEEKGFVGSVTVLALYSVILFAGIRIAGEARDRLGKLLAVGAVTLLFSHIFINIGMNIRIVPVTGVPLPLLSYGGSSVVSSLIAIGILQNVYMYRRSY
jgi:rod shape determining protein RodA